MARALRLFNRRAQLPPQRLGLLERLGVLRAPGAPRLQGLGIRHGGAARRQQEQPVAGFIVPWAGGGYPGGVEAKNVQARKYSRIYQGLNTKTVFRPRDRTAG